MTNTNFRLVFKNWLHYMDAARFLSERHTEFRWNDRQMTLFFYSEENLDEMKLVFDILGWKPEKLTS